MRGSRKFTGSGTVYSTTKRRLSHQAAAFRPGFANAR